MEKATRFEAVAIETSVIDEGQPLLQFVVEELSEAETELESGDVLCLADKLLSYSEGRIARFDEVTPTPEAHDLAARCSLEPEFVQVVIDESDQVLGGVEKALLTIKDGNLVANAGVDHKNAPPESAVLWPEDADRSARLLSQGLEEEFGIRLGVLVVDSRVLPLRLGTTGFTVGLHGFRPLRDYRGDPDLFDRRILITQQNVADDIAASAHLLMGEGDERTPLVLARGAPVVADGSTATQDLKISKDRCLVMGNVVEWRSDSGTHGESSRY